MPAKSMIEQIKQTVANKITESGGNQNDLDIWASTWKSLSTSCNIYPGPPDDYTKDIVLCWSGWVLVADPDATDRIYAACKGFNLDFKNDELGMKACNKMYDGIDKHANDPASVYRELAKDQLDRIREQDYERELFGENSTNTENITV